MVVISVLKKSAICDEGRPLVVNSTIKFARVASKNATDNGRDGIGASVGNTS
jgi:hypothetical protein